MIIIGFEDQDGKPVIKTEEEKKEFLEKSGYKKEDVMFADGIPSTAFIGAELLSRGIEKTAKKE